jgi:protein required for attachment to host cells
MSKTWVVVAESSRAKIFELEKRNAPLKELQGLAHTPSRIHEQNILPKAKDNESTTFARTIGHHLEAARNKGKFSRLIIMSPPNFLGKLRKHIGSETNKRVISEVTKNLVKHTTSEIQSHIPRTYVLQ